MPDARRCALCGQHVQAHQPSVATSDGQIAHVACADAEATRASNRRQHWAVGHGCGSLFVIIALSVACGPQGWMVVVAIGSVALHMLIHRRFWYFVLHDLRRWW